MKARQSSLSGTTATWPLLGSSGVSLNTIPSVNIGIHEHASPGLWVR